ncbi:hypothetical protein RB195_024091 [Necator americanus]|uniref:Uncharacterized protein n=1 Tax=Necator americanus TaxID=51031 RepID=A0ABR1ELX3_NECAM
MRAAWAALASVREATDQLTDQDLRAHLFDSTVLPALCYAAETWADTDAAAPTQEECHVLATQWNIYRKQSIDRDGHIMRGIDDRWTKKR